VLPSSDQVRGFIRGLATTWGEGEAPRPQHKVRVIADAAYPTAEITVMDGNFCQVGGATGRFDQELSPGLYLVQYRAGRNVVTVPIAVKPNAEEMRVDPPPLVTKSAAPLANTPAGDRFGQVASDHSRETHVRSGTGGELYVFLRESSQPDEPGPDASKSLFGVSLHNLTGESLIDLAKAGTGADDGTWRACNVSLGPGTYLLRCDAGEIGSLEQSVVVSPGWQTQVFCSPRRYGFQEPTIGADLTRAAVLMARIGTGFAPQDPAHGWTEAARVSLAGAQAAAPKQALADAVQTAKDVRAGIADQSLVAAALAEKLTHPMLGLFGAHLLLLESPTDMPLLREVVANLELLMPDHPDVQALRLVVTADSGSSFRFAIPPMLRSSWGLIVERTVAYRQMVPADSYAGRIAARTWGGGSWLTWKPPSSAEPPADAEAHSPRSQPSAAFSVGAAPLADDAGKWETLRKVIADALPRHDTDRFLAWWAQRLGLDQDQTRVLRYLSGIVRQAQFTQDLIAQPTGLYRRLLEGCYWVARHLGRVPQDDLLEWLESVNEQQRQRMTDEAAVRALGVPQAVVSRATSSLATIVKGVDVMANKKICFDRMLPKDLNKVRPTSPIPGTRTRAAFEWAKLWDLGSKLRVSFLGGTPDQQAVVKKFAPQWAEHANLKLAFENAANAEIRIAFVPSDGSWSYIGTDCKNIPSGQPTMNLGWQDEGVVLHEFGHAIGLIHEHQNPQGGIQWNKPAVYQDLAGPPNYWEPATVDHNLFETYDQNQINGTSLDKESIMLYAIPASWTTDGFSSKPNDVLSQTDKEFAHDPRNYPFKGVRQPHS
jgi:hypothetical protein